MINHQTPAPTRPRSAEGLTAYVYLNISRALADLASVRKDSGDQFLAADSSTWLMVVENSLLLASQR
jgi:hypothetical protein